MVLTLHTHTHTHTHTRAHARMHTHKQLFKGMVHLKCVSKLDLLHKKTFS